MSPQHQPKNSLSDDFPLLRQVDELYTRLQDGIITDPEQEKLNQLLKSTPEARHRYLLNVLLNSLLDDWMGKQDRVEAEQLGIHVDSKDNSDSEPVFLASTSERARRHQWLQIATALVFLVASLLGMSLATKSWWLANRHSPAPRVRVPVLRDDGIGPTSAPPTNQATATIRYVSTAASTKDGLEEYRRGLPLVVGRRLEIDKGAIELEYPSGTKILLIGPADFIVQREGGRLVRGGLVASVSEQGHGFTIVTPNGKVVDLGTEFGVAVDDFGVSQVSVFKGKVEAFPVAADFDGDRKVELLGGDNLQWERGQTMRLDADPRNFATAILGHDTPRGQDIFSQRDDFRGEIDSTRWSSVGSVQRSDRGLVMTAGQVADQRPYLISTDQFDPLMGPVTVTCDFQFSDFDNDDAPVVGIMTRSANERGTAAEPWNGILASCVHCSFGSVSETRAGALQTSVKLGSENLMSSVSSVGKLPPQPHTPYRMVMRDDGVNVSFTVSLRDEASASQTVTCRSLFQGKSNHIALGGLLTGSVLVERLEIVQDQSESTIASYSELCSLFELSPAQRSVERKLLDNFVPENATLVHQDDFSSARIDIAKWRTLGEVFVDRSQINLGVPNDADLIDTWKSRPYLLTDKPLDPNQGPITVIGTVAFASNFRSGYGATFAVMTRANTERGDGHGWENSILQRGIRTTFWPASADKSHSLEIHEKPDANTITLLKKHAVDVDPFTRRYVFRVVDSGSSISLTVVDPKTPNRKMEVRSQTKTELSLGYIGFESCWGSPVKLDNLSIYQDNRSLMKP